MPIRLLPPEVAGKIAAGEVVERPASVVKELVENSIDAGASEIRVEIREGGRRLIRVTDNGCGIPAEELPLAFARHATSKLATTADLDQITTLGFRGEALASIAAVSQVTILSCPRQQETGRLLRVEGGQVVRQESHASPPGTLVAVENLFHNVPVRLKFLRQPQTETGHIHDVVAHCALGYPRIRFGLFAEDRQVFQSAGNGSLHDVLVTVYGLEVAERMLEIVADGERTEDEAAISSAPTAFGYASMPAIHRADRTYMSFFVNRRWVQDRSLVHAVEQAYHTLLPVGRHPTAVIMLDLNPGDVDVNVHPTKREVKFRDSRAVYSCVQRAVRHTLLAHTPAPGTIRSPQTWPAPEWERRQTLVAAGQQGLTPHQLTMEMYRTADLGEGLQAIGPVRLPLLRVIGQLGQTYIIAEGPQGMYLVDQHAAHERILYEQMVASISEQHTTSQQLLAPLILDLDPMLAGVLADSLPLLDRAGFLIEPFGGASYLLRAVPSILAVPDIRTALVDILEMLRQDDDPLTARSEERLIAAVCKRAAIKAGQSLSLDEMQQLVRQLEQCESPRTCPHGRPTVAHFSVEQLEKEFGRR